MPETDPQPLTTEERPTSWTDQKWHRVSSVDAAFWAKHNPRQFRCGLCGAKFVVGDDFRWVYCNSDERSAGNFFVGRCCDGDDVKRRRLALYDEWRRIDKLVGRGDDD